MKAFDIYKKTMKFVWLKLALGGALFAGALLLGGIFFLIASLAKNEIVSIVLMLIWIFGIIAMDNVITHYFGYLIKAGHIAIVSEIVTTGKIPDNQYEVAVSMVKSRFKESSVYFLVDKLVSGAVKELQKGVGKVGDALDAIPGMSAITNFIQIFIGIVLGYIDECCLGYTFYKKDQGAFKSACDGITIYWKNKKKLLKDAAIMALVVMVITAVLFIIPLVIMVPLALLTDNTIVVVCAVIGSAIIAGIVKSAFVDSWMMVKMMTSYMEDAPTTAVDNGIYDTLCKLSGKFKQLFNKSQEAA